MTKAVTFYRKDSGTFHSHWIGPDALVPLNTPMDCAAVDGHHDLYAQRVEIATGKIVDYQPPQPSADHEWNAERKRWQLNGKALKRQWLLAKIAAIEATQPRAIREHALGYEGALERLREIDQAIEAARTELRALV